jgi:UDP-glucose 4-epimerase
MVPEMKVLVTGGAGYIGSHTVLELVAAGMEPVIADNFANSSPKVLARLEQISGRKIGAHEVDVADAGAFAAVMAQEKPEAVIHFAGLKAVGESVEQPERYYRNNLMSTLSVCEAMQQVGTGRLVFSSSATVYSSQAKMPVAEDGLLGPINPYGQTKLMSEQILRDVALARPELSVTLLRYFNPVGAHASGLIGEDPKDEPNNLMPYVSQVAVGRRPAVRVFGNDYPTVDGTGVRDYLHVVDLARAHVAALRGEGVAGVRVYNLGTGRGVSVLELVKAYERACGHEIKYEIVGRRAGDVAAIYADPGLAERELGWKAELGLDEMCADAWRWQSRNPKGYEG